MRINARLDENHARKLNYLLETTHSSTSEIITRAIDVYYEQIKQSRPEAANILQASGFIGCGEAPPELAENYQAENVRLQERAGYVDELRAQVKALQDRLAAPASQNQPEAPAKVSKTRKRGG
jgi:hypothetical protein